MMKNRSGNRVGLMSATLASFALTFMWMSSALGDAKCDGRVCPDKFECRTETSNCPPEEPTCTPLEDTWCQSPDCQTDAQCPSGMRCVTSDRVCRPRYELPCDTSSDCGPGFTCETVEGAPERYCGFSVTACTLSTASHDCAAGWTCVENVHGLCANTGDPHTGCNPGDPEFVCLPPYLDGVTTTLDGNAEPSETGDAASDGGCSIGIGSAASGSAASGSAAWLLAGLIGCSTFVRRARKRRERTR